MSRNTSLYWSKPQPPRHSVVFQSPARYDSNQVAVVPYVHLLENGNLVSSFSYYLSLSDAVQLDNKRPAYVSSDLGRTWNPQKGNPPGLFRDPTGIGSLDFLIKPARLPDGSLMIVVNGGHENFPAAKKDELVKKGYIVFEESHGNAPGVVSISYRVWKSVSLDMGKTWRTTQIELPLFIPHIGCYHFEGLALSDGTYLHPASGILDLKKHPRGSSFVLRCPDSGRTWDIHMVAESLGSRPGFNETTMTQARNGDVLALMRTTGQRELWIASSSDGGQSWSQPHDSGLRGSTPWMVTMPDGTLLAVFGRRAFKYFPRTGIWYGLSRDNGQTWQQRMLVDRGGELVAAQGMVVPLPDGSAYVVYSFLNSKAIGGTRFHPDYQP